MKWQKKLYKEEFMNSPKMYILVLDDVPKDKVPVICAHASLSCFLMKQNDFSDEFQDWINSSFAKVVCSVTRAEFERAIQEPGVSGIWITTESSLGGREVAVTFVPKREFPKFFKFFKLWKAN